MKTKLEWLGVGDGMLPIPEAILKNLKWTPDTLVTIDFSMVYPDTLIVYSGDEETKDE